MSLITIGVVLLIIAIVAYLLGAREIAGMTAGLGKIILIIGLLIAVVLFFFGSGRFHM